MSNNNNNVLVYCRIKPDLKDLIDPNETRPVKKISSQTISGTNTKKTQNYHFDYIFDQHTSQDEVYQTCVQPLLEKVRHGYNCSLLAYGQSGSGKTYTISGDSVVNHNRGMIPRIASELIAMRQNKLITEMRFSMIELYLGDITDIINPSQSLKLLNTTDKIEGLSDYVFYSLDDFYIKYNVGQNNRSVRATKLNDHSTRSHVILTFHVVNNNLSSTFHVVDLSGSENVKTAGTAGESMKEGISTNQGLFFLGRTVDNIIGKRPPSYGSHPLTKYLRNALGGNSKTTFIFTVRNDPSFAEETVRTLEFASNVSKVVTKAIVNTVVPRRDLELLIDQLKRKIESLTDENIKLIKERDHYKQLSETPATEVEMDDEMKKKGDEELAKKNKMLSDNLIIIMKELESYKEKYKKAIQDNMSDEESSQNNNTSNLREIEQKYDDKADYVTNRRIMLQAVMTNLDEYIFSDKTLTVEQFMLSCYIQQLNLNAQLELKILNLQTQLKHIKK